MIQLTEEAMRELREDVASTIKREVERVLRTTLTAPELALISNALVDTLPFRTAEQLKRDRQQSWFTHTGRFQDLRRNVSVKSPPAFPPHPNSINGAGMSLRDYFAASDVSSFIAPQGAVIAEEVAANAYKIADAMLKEREK